MAEEDRNGENLGQSGGEAAEGVGAESCDQSAFKTGCAHGGVSMGEEPAVAAPWYMDRRQLLEDASANDVPLARLLNHRR